nr:ribonuclease H-like domain, reverse transcriptase, RNA-dependent DNA polymerase [Tanacetum cinerariifolium]
MDVKSAFLYGTIDEEVYVTQPPDLYILSFLIRSTRVVKALYGLHQAPRAWYATLSTFLEKSGYRRGAIDKTLFIKQDKKDIMLVQVYVDDIIFCLTKKSWCDKFEELMKNRFQMSYMGELTFFLGLQTIVATSTTEAEYIATAHCHGQVLWIQNQILDYGFNLMNTKIYIDNESIICIVKNPVFHSKTKHIEIRHHFIRDSYQKKLIQVLKIHTDDNVADLLTKAFDVSSKELASLKQMTLGKDESNPLIVNSLLKTIWLSMHHVIAMKHWPFQSKRLLSEGFKQILDFLNGSLVRYALIASPTIRTSYIKRFWSTNKVKTVNDEVKVQALINEKRVTIKETSIRRTLKLDDEEGISCLANDESFTGLANMGSEKISDKLTFYNAFFSPQWKFLIQTILQCLSAKTTSWNEFNSTMASAIICLATNQKFNFSRYILLSLVKNIEAGVPFYMFPRFVQLIVDYQLGDMSHHQDIYDNPSLTKKVFANMKRVGQAQDDVSIPAKPSTSKPHKKPKSKKPQPIAPKVPSHEPSPEHQLPSPSNDPIPDADKDRLKLQELMNLRKRLSNKVLDIENEVIDIKFSFIDKIEMLEDRVHKLEEENRILKEKSFKSAKVNIVAPVEDKEKSFKQGRMITYMDEDVEVNLEETQAKAYNLDLQHSEKVLNMQDIDKEEPAKVEEVLEVVTSAKLMTEVVTTTEPTTIATQVPKASAPRRRRCVIIQDPKEIAASVIMHTKVLPKDKGKGILIKEPKPLKWQA